MCQDGNITNLPLFEKLAFSQKLCETFHLKYILLHHKNPKTSCVFEMEAPI